MNTKEIAHPLDSLARAAIVSIALCLPAPRAQGISEGYAAMPGDQLLSCSPARLSRGQSLRIELGQPHARELAIVVPGGDYFFVALRNTMHTRNTVIPGNLFQGLSSIEIAVNSFVAHRWRAGAPDYEQVFEKAGIYKVILGEPIRTDVMEPVKSCVVTLVD